MQVMTWWPKAQGRPVEQVLGSDFTDAALTLAREYGFADWDAGRALGDMTLDPGFKTALDHIIAGELAALRSDLRNILQLATARTPFGHQSTLLHYLGRQRRRDPQAENAAKRRRPCLIAHRSRR